MFLIDILNRVKVLNDVETNNIEVVSIVFDSREVIKGGLFVAIKGTITDGHTHIDKAIANGAQVVVCEVLPVSMVDGVTYVQVKNSADALGLMASNFYHHPSNQLRLVGVTGTNGKTTIATLLYQLFKSLGYSVGLISTVENKINDEIIPSTHTTPDPIALNKLLTKMVDAGCEFCFMEVSSHAVVQGRIAGLNFEGGIFTNITHDHLDFHETFDNYIAAKQSFFTSLKANAFALTNADEKHGMVMVQNSLANRKTYSLQKLADFKGSIIENKFSGLHMDVDGAEVYFKLIGSFNAYNIMAVYGAAILLGQEKIEVLATLSSLTGAEGRFDFITAENGMIGIVDYAHTPDAVQNVLSTINDIRNDNSKIITVIGCGGDRDKSKRPVMAKVACDWSDKVILTSDNPRTEDPEQILRDMEVGVSPSNQRKTITITDRKSAIQTACHLANAGDVILIAGKGHEKYQEINKVRHHFDDKEVLLEQFKDLR
ncbi:UDP-N-acetylmuramoyl-L-alanyl-D-glutamate--2,6-diaminopimelate ligase [Pedobacter flavus]|uniref:UDP-N-acetylmuramoyl-L-alanyl-D-glutamate--2,6-diaminopimelate ligase n=1 Tax=Pedobacter flavus TaxID=3113906 RepID=A0ABU7GXX2_9SPHI|nr:UDP-N-acetylmuramoyl-L-alanyl-D-glutamate--2,6-diaminopimelate ligase [Pedobacter sp. VNH31]MEE1883893.1 UDP-N-acetylmuramoyl-L-alanyl-D-glutamate--2,6-diaminopimelate ligase [Pedobacter sp. VNH31]